jgi:NAD(P)H-dependent flavin oxidoreductase YrpB (nitropropane dioxygenase family)
LFDFIILCPSGSPDATIPIAGARAGALGLVNLEFAIDLDAGLAQLRRLCELGRGRCGALIDDPEVLAAVLAAPPEGLDTIVLANTPLDQLSALVQQVHDAGCKAYVVATRFDEAVAAADAHADAVIAKGHEAGGWIGDEGSFVLCQRLLATLSVPVYVHGGIGVHTVAAAYVSGAAGAVLDAQLLLTRESPLADGLQAALAGVDGSETLTFGAELGAAFRAYSRHGHGALEQLRTLEHELAPSAESLQSWRAQVKARVGADPAQEAVLALGQDAAFAGDLARRFGNVAGVIDGLYAAIERSCATLAQGNPLAQGAGVAKAHRTRYPIVQGPMTRVSDRAEFAAAVTAAGALPFLALALMRAPEADALLARTAELAGDQPWGVGLLGFVPAALRAEQLEVVRAHRPPFALIAGGRPDQARELEANGIETYLHVPSPGLLKLYLADGARRFVFEGRECGGHVGPRTSFVLWDTMMRVLAEELPGDASDCQILLAGGIHDAKSAAMAAATAASDGNGLPVYQRGDGMRGDHDAVSAGGDQGAGHRAAGERARACHALPAVALRRVLLRRAAQHALGGHGCGGAARPPGGAEHRTPAGRVEGPGPQQRVRTGRRRRGRAVAARHVHDRAGDVDARQRDDAGRAAQRRVGRQQRAARRAGST